MTEIITRGRRLVTAAKNPKSDYSRVVSCGTFLPVAAAYNFGFTAALGQVVWLLGIDIWISCRTVADVHNTIFDVTVGTVEPTTWQQVRDWEKLVPIVTRAGFPFHETYNPTAQYHWSMRRLLEGKPWRFGVWGMTSSGTGGIIEASFEISEG